MERQSALGLMDEAFHYLGMRITFPEGSQKESLICQHEQNYNLEEANEVRTVPAKKSAFRKIHEKNVIDHIMSSDVLMFRTTIPFINTKQSRVPHLNTN